MMEIKEEGGDGQNLLATVEGDTKEGILESCGQDTDVDTGLATQMNDDIKVDSESLRSVKVEEVLEELRECNHGEDDLGIGNAYTSDISDFDIGDSDDCFEEEVFNVQVPDGRDSAIVSKEETVLAEVVKIEADEGRIEYECSACSKRYKFKKSAEYHIKVHHKGYSLSCHVCTKKFKIKGDLDRHLNVHKGVRPFTCPECEKSFVCRSSLMRHRKLQHLVGDIYKCHLCEKTFRIEADLKRHSYTHSGEKPWPCSLCTKSFTSKSSLKVHEKIHDDSQKISCAVCHMMFHIKSDLTRHESLHTGDLKWECAICGKKYSGKSAVKRHIKDAHIFGKFKFKKEMTVVDVLNSLSECAKDLKGFSAFTKYNEDKSVDNVLKAVDCFIIYRGGNNNEQKDS